MNIDDILTSRVCFSNEYLIQVTQTSAQLLPVNKHRVVAVISSPSSSSMWLTISNNIASGVGMFVNNGLLPLVFNAQEHSGLCKEQFNATLTSGTQTIAVWEVIAPSDSELRTS